MSFPKGHKFSPGGTKGNKGGRPSREKKRIKKAAEALARQYIERHIKPVLLAYKQLAGGRKIKHRSVDGKKVLYTEFEADPATTRHYIDKFMPAVRTEADVNVKGIVEIFTNVSVEMGPPPKAKKDE